VDWSKFFDLGGVAGFLALIWQGVGAVRRRRRAPTIHIHSFDPAHDLKFWQLDPEGSEIRRAITLDISNKGADTATRCVATLEVTTTPTGVKLRERRYALHWAGVDYSYQNTGSQPVDIGPEIRRLDVAFTRAAQDIGGCWIATPMALSLPSIDQAYLPPGKYEGVLSIHCENGRGARLKIALDAPEKWQDLAANFFVMCG
jgi:hypothetical protein